ncbi:MAG: hypothetical protein HQK55_16520, partial [Deltaproteobacteria bacterium]|nr:hypothetical protein [Deltaproteobacteria bacterium]
MDQFLEILMLFLVLSMGLVIVVGGRGITGKRHTDNSDPDRWPFVSLIVPATGTDANLAACVRALLDMDYPNYQVVGGTQG